LVKNRDFRPTLLRYVTFPIMSSQFRRLLSSICDVRNFVAYSQGLTFHQYFCTGW